MSRRKDVSRLWACGVVYVPAVSRINMGTRRLGLADEKASYVPLI